MRIWQWVWRRLHAEDRKVESGSCHSQSHFEKLIHNTSQKHNSQKSTTPFIHNNMTRNDTKFPPQTYFLLKDIHDKFTTEKNRGAVKRHLGIPSGQPHTKAVLFN
jgi:hypothetical protein